MNLTATIDQKVQEYWTQVDNLEFAREYGESFKSQQRYLDRRNELFDEIQDLCLQNAPQLDPKLVIDEGRSHQS